MGARGIGANTTRAAISSIAAAVHDVWASSLIFYFLVIFRRGIRTGKEHALVGMVTYDI